MSFPHYDVTICPILLIVTVERASSKEMAWINLCFEFFISRLSSYAMADVSIILQVYIP